MRMENGPMKLNNYKYFPLKINDKYIHIKTFLVK